MSDTERRLEDLEVKLSFQEKLLSDLDDVVRQTRDALEALRRDVRALTEELERGRPEAPVPPEEEVPPHY